MNDSDKKSEMQLIGTTKFSKTKVTNSAVISFSRKIHQLAQLPNRVNAACYQIPIRNHLKKCLHESPWTGWFIRKPAFSKRMYLLICKVSENFVRRSKKLLQLLVIYFHITIFVRHIVILATNVFESLLFWNL